MFRLLSFDFRVLSSIPEVEERVGELLAPFHLPEPGPPEHEFRVLVGDETIDVEFDGNVAHRARRTSGAVDWILWKASSEAIAGIRDHIAIHAGAVGSLGVAVLLPAPPDSGKTTLTAALSAAGFSYFSDEAALIAPASGRLVPFPRALWLERGSIVALDRFLGPDAGTSFTRNGTSHVAAARLLGGIAGESTIRHIVFPRYTEGASTSLTPVSRAEALVELGRNAFNLDAFGKSGLDALARVVRGADVHRLIVGDLSSAVGAISTLVGKGGERSGAPRAG
jgi:hypothetical protein